MNKYAIGNNNRLLCKMKKITLQTLANEIGVGHQTMSNWINGHRQITSYGLYRVSKVLGETMERLMEGIEDE